MPGLVSKAPETLDLQARFDVVVFEHPRVLAGLHLLGELDQLGVGPESVDPIDPRDDLLGAQPGPSSAQSSFKLATISAGPIRASPHTVAVGPSSAISRKARLAHRPIPRTFHKASRSGHSSHPIKSCRWTGVQSVHNYDATVSEQPRSPIRSRRRTHTAMPKEARRHHATENRSARLPRRRCFDLHRVLGSQPLGLGRRCAGERRRNPIARPSNAAVEALTEHGYLYAEWSDAAYRGASKYWDEPGPDPEKDPEGYARAFGRRLWVSSAPYPNDGLPMGLRRSVKRDGVTTGVQVDCMVCHGGSIGGKSYVGLPNTQIDYETLFLDMFRADGRRMPIIPFILGTARGTTNAGMMAVVLAQLPQRRPLATDLPGADGIEPPRAGRPAVVGPQAQDEDVLRRPHAGRVGPREHAVPARREDPRRVPGTGADVPRHPGVPVEHRAPQVPVPDRRRPGRSRADRLREDLRRCHGTYGETVSYPGKIVPLDVVGTDPERIRGMADRAVAHYNTTWFAENHPGPDRRGRRLPGAAARRHLGERPISPQRLGPDPRRPARFVDPPQPVHSARPRPTSSTTTSRTSAGSSRRSTNRRSTARKRDSHKAHFIYDTSRYGLGNGGHTFGDKLSEGDRADLIEYLKTL